MEGIIILTPHEIKRRSLEFQERAKPYMDLIAYLSEIYSTPYIIMEKDKVEFFRKTPKEIEVHILELQGEIEKIKSELFPFNPSPSSTPDRSSQ